MIVTLAGYEPAAARGDTTGRAAGEILRDLIIEPGTDYQPTGRAKK